MKKFYLKALQFWFILLFVAIINATIRETTYKPLLTPYIGMWAHQISSLTGIFGFFMAIYFYLKNIKDIYSTHDLITIGSIWIVMTIIFESFINMYIRKLSFDEVLQTYFFWKGDTWIFVLLSLLISPLIASSIIQQKRKN